MKIKKIKKTLKKSEVLKSLAITVITAFLGYIFYLLAYIFLYAYYFHGSEMPIFRVLINPIPFEAKSLVFFGVILALAIASYSYIVYKMYAVDNHLLLLVYTFFILLLTSLFIFGLLLFSNKTIDVKMPFSVALIPTVFSLILYMVYRFKWTELFLSFLLSAIIALAISSANNVSFIEIYENSFWFINIITTLFCLCVLPKKITIKIVQYFLLFWLSIISLDKFVLPLIKINMLFAIIYFIVPIIIMFIVYVLRRRISFNLTNYIKSSTIYADIKRIIKDNITVMAFMSIMIGILFLCNFVYNLGKGFSDYISDDSYVTVNYVDQDGVIGKIDGLIVAYSDGVYYLSTRSHEKVTITNLLGNIQD